MFAGASKLAQAYMHASCSHVPTLPQAGLTADVKGGYRLGRPPPKAGLTACLLTSRLGSTHSAAEILRWLAPLRNAIGGDANDNMLLWATPLEVDLLGVVLAALGASYRGAGAQ